MKIRHNSVYTTAYLHLSKYASGLKVGSGFLSPVIGYVGSTGMPPAPISTLGLETEHQSIRSKWSLGRADQRLIKQNSRLVVTRRTLPRISLPVNITAIMCWICFDLQMFCECVMVSFNIFTSLSGAELLLLLCFSFGLFSLF